MTITVYYDKPPVIKATTRGRAVKFFVEKIL